MRNFSIIASWELAFDFYRASILICLTVICTSMRRTRWLLKLLLDASGKQGVPQGGVISPLLKILPARHAGILLELRVSIQRLAITIWAPHSIKKSLADRLAG
jgi:hypothetical protein